MTTAVEILKEDVMRLSRQLTAAALCSAALFAVTPAQADTTYLEYLLERLCWVSAPGRLEFREYQQLCKDDFNASKLREN